MVKISCGKDNILNKFEALKLIFFQNILMSKCLYLFLYYCFLTSLSVCLLILEQLHKAIKTMHSKLNQKRIISKKKYLSIDLK